jgi:hypothetical protein
MAGIYIHFRFHLRLVYQLLQHNSASGNGRVAFAPQNTYINYSCDGDAFENLFIIREMLRPCHSSGGYSPASQSGGPGSSLGQVMWDLWWTKWHWGRFSPNTSVSPANSHSTDSSTLVIYHPGLVK